MEKKRLAALVMAVLFNCVMGSVMAAAMGFSPIAGAVGMNCVGVLLSGETTQGALRAGVCKEIWTGELVKSLRGFVAGTWLDGIPDNSSIVENDVIHLVEVGVDPEVLVNNMTYPIPLQALDDKDIAVKLDKFQTKVTPITDDELYSISYDKIARVKESHSYAINDAKFAKAAHALCAKSDSATTPVLKTTGEKDAATGRLKMTVKDVLAMKTAMDKLGVPTTNRRLVLCTDHVNDLLAADQTFKEQYNIDRNTGKVGKLYGFDIYEYENTPYYAAAGTKKAVGDKGGTAGDFHCSFAFYTPRVFKATGSTKMYWSAAENDPEYQRNKVNFRHYFVCMPKKEDAGVVMRSDYKAG